MNDEQLIESLRAGSREAMRVLYERHKDGTGERTFWQEIEENGTRIRLYRVRYTLSSGQVVTMCEGEEVR